MLGTAAMMSIRLLLVPVLLAVASPARAAEENPDQATTAGSAPRAPKLSLTTDVVRPVTGIATLSGEAVLGHGPAIVGLRPMDVTATVVLGGGHVRSNERGAMPVWGDCEYDLRCDRANVALLGVQAAAYPVGSFRHGMQIGVQGVMLVSFDRETSLRENGRVSTSGRPWEISTFSPGAFLGYKLATRSGFTVNPQVSWNIAVGSLDVLRGGRLALNAGWSF